MATCPGLCVPHVMCSLAPASHLEAAVLPWCSWGTEGAVTPTAAGQHDLDPPTSSVLCSVAAHTKLGLDY